MGVGSWYFTKVWSCRMSIRTRGDGGALQRAHALGPGWKGRISVAFNHETDLWLLLAALVTLPPLNVHTLDALLGCT